MKKQLSAFLFIALFGAGVGSSFGPLSALSAQADAAEAAKKPSGYVASKTAKVFYKASCAKADAVKPEDKETFKTKSAAEKAGYKYDACKA